MERRSFQTPLGEVWLWGRPETFERPFLLVLAGANADPDNYQGLDAEFPVLIGHVPSYNCPPLVTQSVGAFAAAYTAVLDQIGQRCVVMGVSLGGTTALALRTPLVRAILALEPLMTTGGAWPVRKFLKPRHQADRDLLWSVFGVGTDTHVNRDYFSTLAGLTAPTRVLVSADPLGEPRVLPRMPSLLPEEDRRRLSAHPMVSVAVVSGAGHDLGAGASNVILDELRALWANEHGDGEPVATSRETGDLSPAAAGRLPDLAVAASVTTLAAPEG